MTTDFKDFFNRRINVELNYDSYSNWIINDDFKIEESSISSSMEHASISFYTRYDKFYSIRINIEDGTERLKEIISLIEEIFHLYGEEETLNQLKSKFIEWNEY